MTSYLIFHVHSPERERAVPNSGKNIKISRFGFGKNYRIVTEPSEISFPVPVLVVHYYLVNTRSILSLLLSYIYIGGVYKPREQTRGEGVAQMTTTLNNSYLV